MKVLITGGEGFIGSEVSRVLRERDHDVFTIDHHDGADIVGDVRMYFTGALQDYKPDVVLHLAALVTRAACEARPDAAIHNNVELTAFVARECSLAGVRLAYASTSEVYGDRGALAIVHEETRPRPSSGIYGMTKLWGEHLVDHYCDSPLIMRLCMAYGPGMDVGPGKPALPTFIYNALRREPIEVHRCASRSWCYITDIARAIVVLLFHEAKGIWNVGREDDQVPMLRVARMACDLTGADIDLIKFVDAPELQTVIKQISCQKLRKTYGWQPAVSLDDGMRLVCDELRERVAEPSR